MNSRSSENKASKKQSSISAEDIIYTEAIDTFNDEGKSIYTLALHKDKRTAFFKTHNLIKPLLLLAYQNPLLEEGKYISPFNREHDGEFFLPHEAFNLLIHYKIMQHHTKPGAQAYNTKNIFIVYNNEIKLLSVLQNLKLNDAEDAKFIYIQGIHVIPFYLRREKNELKCFIVDPEKGASRAITFSLQKAFGNIKIIASNTLLQLDFFSCPTFGLKTLMYFVKHGDEIFPYLEKQNVTQQNNINLLNSTDLMPELLKMCQTISKLYQNLSSTNKETLVSKQQNLKLLDYLKQYEFTVKDKTYNTRAIQLKYETFAFLNNCLQKELNPEEKSELLSGKLPNKLKKIIASFEELKQTREEYKKR